MNEQEETAFRDAYLFYRKWRETVIETDEQWEELARDVGEFGRKHSACQLARNLIAAVLDTLNELYKGGMKPMPANYFGRDDL